MGPTLYDAPRAFSPTRGGYTTTVRVMNKVRKTTGCCFAGVHLQRFFFFLPLSFMSLPTTAYWSCLDVSQSEPRVVQVPGVHSWKRFFYCY